MCAMFNMICDGFFVVDRLEYEKVDSTAYVVRT